MEVTDFDPAIKYCNKAIYLDPENAMHGQPGSILSSIGKNEEALKCIDKALKIDPDNGEIWASKEWYSHLTETSKKPGNVLIKPWN